MGRGGNDTRQMGSEEQSEDACILSGDPDFALTENDRSKGCDSDVDIMLF